MLLKIPFLLLPFISLALFTNHQKLALDTAITFYFLMLIFLSYEILKNEKD